jgi:hypothetical protein
MFDETAGDLAELAAELHEQHRPADATERFLVDTLISNEWRLRRLRRVESDLWQAGVDAYLDRKPELQAATSGEAFTATGPAFERLQRIVNCCERNYHRALKQLIALQAAPADGQRTEQPAEPTATSASSGSFRKNPETPAAVPQKAAPEVAPEPAKAAEPTAEDLIRQHREDLAAFDASVRTAFQQS